MKRKKNLWRLAFLLMAVWSGLELLGCMAAWIIGDILGGISFNVTRASTVGIIGGADGPTSVFVTAAPGSCVEILFWLVLLTAAVLGLRCLRKERKNT